jgi:hypothetical protein
MVTAILDAGVCKLGNGMEGYSRLYREMRAYPESEELDVWILVVQPTLQRTHGVFGRGGLGPYLIAYFEVEGDVLRACGQEL